MLVSVDDALGNTNMRVAAGMFLVEEGELYLVSSSSWRHAVRVDDKSLPSVINMMQ